LPYSISDIARIIQAGNAIVSDDIIDHLLIDSRKIISPSTSLFFALKGARRDGQQFIPELYRKGIRNFVVSETLNDALYADANVLVVNDTLLALQELVAWHRKQFPIPVIGITGSNGKTIVKEWLYQLLQDDYNIVRSPKSFNSQIGVPLSVWQMNAQHTLAIFEAGISKQGEMKNLERIIHPTIGLLTNILDAHSEGFNDLSHKFREKVILFQHCSTLLARRKDVENRRDTFDMLNDNLRVLTWGTETDNDFIIRDTESDSHTRALLIGEGDDTFKITIPFTDDASVENAISCFCLLRVLGVPAETIERRMKALHPVNMRLELKDGINHCSIINDSYSADLYSLNIALRFLEQQGSDTKRTVILSDFLQSGLDSESLYSEIAQYLGAHRVEKVIGIGKEIATWLSRDADKQYQFYPTTEDFLHQFRTSQFKEETILVKGARVFGFEKIVQQLEQQVHQTVLEINLNAIVHNLKQYQGLLEPRTKVMAMVKAFAYGSGGAEIAGILQYHKVDYLGVAYADEGVELRKAGIHLPIMVMNPEESAFESLVEYNLEPDLYSFEMLHKFETFIEKEGLQQYPVHIEIETGMNRLGFSTDAMVSLVEFLRSTSSLKVQSVFSHLVASEDPGQDEFTFSQNERFIQAAVQLEKQLGYPLIKHIGNSAAIIRYPNLHLDMVRLGIGLYGVDSANTHTLDLQPVAALRSTIAQIKHIKTGESVSYNRKTIVTRDSVIATVRIGYADGFPRKLGNGAGKILVKDTLVPVMGTVCMDMTMIDITGIPGIAEGDDVIIFGPGLPVQQLAGWAGTIPYEIMTGVSQRVKRIYYEE
jgi:alanine racemase